ncbi:MAG: tryptophan synthase subunit alpha [Alphaproteobacteria bacterium]|nr:tryptophan synthase subunit alpha [Alphaproteobacteria bacterium]
MTERIKNRFQALKKEGRSGLITFTTAGDPDFETSLEILKSLPKAGADLIELGIPFSDPIADGKAIQEASQRALKAGMNVKRVLDMVSIFRENDKETPIILMGYYNPVYKYGVDAFAKDAAKAGVDGLIIVDVPPEEADELLIPLKKNNLDMIFLATQTTDDERLPKVLKNAGGFIYYVSIAGITGAASASEDAIKTAVKRLRKYTKLPIAVDFDIKTPKQVKAVANLADAIVVGSAIVKIIEDSKELSKQEIVGKVLEFVKTLAIDKK